MKLALTGATGFVGSTLLDLAVAEGHLVHALTRRDQKEREGVTWVRGDLANGDALRELVADSDAIVHVAGTVNAADEHGFILGNVAGTQELLAAADESDLRRFIHISSLSVRHPDLSLYGRTKREGELAVEASARKWTIVRPPAIYGPRDTEMFELFRAAKLGIVPLPPEGRASIIHVADLAALLLALATDGGTYANKIFEADDGHAGGWRHVDLAHAIGAAMGRRVLPLSMPGWMVKCAAGADRLLRGDYAKLTPDRAGYMVHPDWVIDPAKRPPADLWEPKIRAEDGFAETVRWYRGKGWL